MTVAENWDELKNTGAVDPIKQGQKAIGGLAKVFDVERPFFSLDRLEGAGEALSGVTGAVYGTGTQIGKFIADSIPTDFSDQIVDGIVGLFGGETNADREKKQKEIEEKQKKEWEERKKKREEEIKKKEDADRKANDNEEKKKKEEWDILMQGQKTASAGNTAGAVSDTAGVNVANLSDVGNISTGKTETPPSIIAATDRNALNVTVNQPSDKPIPVVLTDEKGVPLINSADRKEGVTLADKLSGQTGGGTPAGAGATTGTPQVAPTREPSSGTPWLTPPKEMGPVDSALAAASNPVLAALHQTGANTHNLPGNQWSAGQAGRTGNATQRTNNQFGGQPTAIESAKAQAVGQDQIAQASMPSGASQPVSTNPPVPGATVGPPPKGQAFLGWAKESVKSEFIKRGYSPEQAEIFSRGAAAQLVQETGWNAGSKQVGQNNFFNIKETKTQKGDVEGKRAYDKAEKSNDVYAGYSTPEKGIAAYVDFLTKNPRYAKAGLFESKSSEEYAQALQKAGFATDASYAKSITSIMNGKKLDASISAYQKQTPDNAKQTNTPEVAPAPQPTSEGQISGSPAKPASQGVPGTPAVSAAAPAAPKIAKTTMERFEQAKGNILNASKTTGVDAGTLAKIMNIESKFDPTAQPISKSNPSANKYTPAGIEGAKAGISSAHGYGQFLNSTWREQVMAHGAKYGVKGTGPGGKITAADADRVRADTKVQAGMLAEYSKQGISLGEKYGAKDKDASVYAHHNLGPAGAKRLFEAVGKNPNAPITSVLTAAEIKNNPSLYKPGMTAAQAYANLGEKMRAGESLAQSISAPAAQTQSPSPPITSVQTATDSTVSAASAADAAIPENMMGMRIKTSAGNTKTLKDLGVKTYADLQKKGGQAFGGGQNDPATLYATGLVANELGSNFNRLTAQNDLYHQKNAPTSSHTQGNKTDFTVKGMSYADAHKKTSAVMAKYGLKEGKDFSIISKSHGTGDHIDFKLNNSGKQKMAQVMAQQQGGAVAETTPTATSTPPTRLGLKEDSKLLGSGATTEGPTVAQQPSAATPASASQPPVTEMPPTSNPEPFLSAVGDVGRELTAPALTAVGNMMTTILHQDEAYTHNLPGHQWSSAQGSGGRGGQQRSITRTNTQFGGQPMALEMGSFNRNPILENTVTGLTPPPAEISTLAPNEIQALGPRMAQNYNLLGMPNVQASLDALQAGGAQMLSSLTPMPLPGVLGTGLSAVDALRQNGALGPMINGDVAGLIGRVAPEISSSINGLQGVYNQSLGGGGGFAHQFNQATGGLLKGTGIPRAMGAMLGGASSVTSPTGGFAHQFNQATGDALKGTGIPMAIGSLMGGSGGGPTGGFAHQFNAVTGNALKGTGIPMALGGALGPVSGLLGNALGAASNLFSSQPALSPLPAPSMGPVLESAGFNDKNSEVLSNATAQSAMMAQVSGKRDEPQRGSPERGSSLMEGQTTGMEVRNPESSIRKLTDMIIGFSFG